TPDPNTRVAGQAPRIRRNGNQGKLGKLRRSVDSRAQGPRAREAAARHVHAYRQSAARRAGGHRQRGRRGTRGTRDRDRRHAARAVCVDDDGRGIPFGLHPDEAVSVLEIVYTRLHAGGKFDKGAGGAYSFSGGLHGVGVSVTNALAKRLDVTVWRAGQVASIAFAGGDVVEPLKVRRASAGDRKNGTTVRAWPDPKYF